MNESLVIGLLQNIAILISFSLLYDYIWVKDKTKQTIINKIITGCVIGSLGLLLMFTPWTFVPGLVFDTRSIILAIAGLFFGPLPTIVAMIITSLYRIYTGGDGMIMGIAVIILSGTTGIIWNLLRKKSRRNLRLIDLYILGIVVHLLMLACIVLLPVYLQLPTLKNIVFPVLIIYPLGTMLLGALMVKRINYWDTKRELKDSEKRFKMLFERAPIGYQSLDENGNFIEVNETWLELMGYSKEEVIGKWFGNFLAPQYVEAFKKRFPLFKELGKIHSEFEMVKKDGSIIVTSFEGRIGYTPSNKFKQTHCVLTDITERRNAEIGLIESEEKYRRITENAQDIIFRYDILPTMRLTYINKAVVNITGYTPEECLADPQLMFSLIHPDDKPIMQQYVETLQSPQEPFTLRWIDKKGSFHWIETRVVAVFDNDGNMIAVEGISRDVTNEIKSKDAIKASEEKYKLIYENAGAGIGYFSTNGIILALNEMASLNMSKQPEDFIGKSIIDILPKERAEINLNRISIAADSDHKTEYEEFVELPSGNKWLYSVYTRVKDASGNVVGVQIVSQDITEKKESEEIQKVLYYIANAVLSTKDLEELIDIIRSQLSSLIDTTNFYIAFYDAETDMLSSPYERDERDNILSWPADKSTTGYVIKHQKTLLANEEKIKELCEAGEIEMLGFPAKIWLGVPLHIDDEIIGALVVQSYNDSNAFNQKHVEILEFVSHQISLSLQRKRIYDDLKVALKHAEESDHLKTAFLANMSHEIRTPMNGILGFSDLLDDDNIKPEDRKSFVEIIRNSGRHLLSIINDIIDIAKIDSGSLRTSSIDFNLNYLLDELYLTFQNEKIVAGKEELNIELVKDFEDEESYIFLDDTRLKQILLNLLSNALKFTNKGHIRFGYTVLDDKLLFFVEDTGKGIAKDKQKIIFERFRQEEENYTRQFGGTGLGLSISIGLVELLGGEMWLVSEEGEGSTFYFTTPYKKTNVPDFISQYSYPPSAKMIAGKKILIAEDMQDNIDLLKQILNDTGLQLIFATNGEEAISICRDQTDIDLVLMDIQMPIFNGFDATIKIKEHRPDLKIIAMTAYAMAEEKAKCLERGCDDYISKPFNKNDLFDIINKYL